MHSFADMAGMTMPKHLLYDMKLPGKGVLCGDHYLLDLMFMHGKRFDYFTRVNTASYSPSSSN